MDEKGKGNTRNSQYELLRIVGMILIMLYHSMNHGGISAMPDNIGSNAFIGKVFYMGGKVGVNVFIILSSFFYSEKTLSYENVIPKIKGVMDVVLQYAIVIYFIAILAAVNHIIPEPLFGEGGVITPYNFLRTLFPLVYSNNWYASAYVIFLFVLPILNSGMRQMGENDYKVVLFGLLAFLVIGPTISGDIIISASNQASNLSWFITLYIMTAYLKKYKMERLLEIKKGTYLMVIVICYIIFVGSILLLDFFGLFFQVNQPTISVYMMQINYIPVVVCSFSIFLYFSKLNFFSSLINNLGGLVFGIYLLHDNPFVSKHIWNLFISGAESLNSGFFAFITLVKVIFVFAVCALIEYLRGKSISMIKTMLVHGVDRGK